MKKKLFLSVNLEEKIKEINYFFFCFAELLILKVIIHAWSASIPSNYREEEEKKMGKTILN